MGKASDGWPSTLIDASAAHGLVCCVTSNCDEEADHSFSYLKFTKLLLEYCNLIFFFSEVFLHACSHVMTV
jgi:hypothetical protein